MKKTFLQKVSKESKQLPTNNSLFLFRLIIKNNLTRMEDRLSKSHLLYN